ncbi:helix-turn-helix domain-containing protein [Rossellomorea vietnamensis]|uniref:Helix-turn-helix domain-containing protein n=1 Tax=Rossellomorea vietnamensis TaxID=218284 RepID=A0ACD4CAT2_9BACI|nr:RodZ family helix-turn-helix domain-containing protein [Rossellomorea vietnamensis]UXH45349.1 helix-turn-helix domain-containing protein [Rossellomorea vietnamensis]
MTELGNRLKEAREAKNYSLDDLQRITKIQKRYLIGIEEGNYDAMPGKFYVRAFIKQYCEAVGLPPEVIFEEHKAEIPTTYEDEIPVSLSRVQSRKSVSESSTKVFDFLPKLLIALFVIGALVAVWVFWQGKVGDKAPESNQEENQTQVDVDENKSAEGDKPEDETNDKEQTEEVKPSGDQKDGEDNPQPEQSLEAVNSSDYKTTYELKNAKEFKLQLSAKGDTWVKVFDTNEQVLFEGLLKQGIKKDFDLSDDKQAYLIIGDASNTDISVNGKQLEYKISATDVVRQDIIINYAPQEQ